MSPSSEVIRALHSVVEELLGAVKAGLVEGPRELFDVFGQLDVELPECGAC